MWITSVRPRRDVQLCIFWGESRLSAGLAPSGTRFLREWDTSNHDPATAAKSLADFAGTLRALFVDGYIMFDSSQEIAGLGKAKTITQIAMEQCQDMVVIRWGSRSKCLWSATSKSECAAVLAEMRSVVEDTLSRMAADFHTQDLYMTFEVLDVCAWEKVLAATPDPAEQRGRKTVLMRKARRLCDALGVPFDAEKFARMVKGAVQLRRRLTKTVAGVDNREVWALLLAQSVDFKWALPIIQFYVAHPDGTGDIERGLGEHARFRDSHRGAPDGPDLSATEMCLEIKQDGPQVASQVFVQGPDGTLLLTDFSRQLATLWLERHGRRFACAKPRCDRGKKGTGWRLKGSLKAVSLLQKAATKSLVEQAARDGTPGAASSRGTIIGARHGDLMRKVAQTGAPEASKRMLDFRKTTEQRREQKTRFESWPGFAPTPPKLRRKPGLTNGHRLGEPARASTMARQALKWKVRRDLAKPRAATLGPEASAAASKACPVLVVCNKPSGDEPARKYRKVTSSVAARAKAIVVPSHDDLHKADASDDMLMTWLSIVAYGKTVHARNEPKKPVTYTAAAPAAVTCSERFSQKHKRLTAALQTICTSKSSRWQTAPAGEKRAVQIDDFEDLRKLLISSQRLPHIAGVESKYAAAAETATTTRFGNARVAARPRLVA